VGQKMFGYAPNEMDYIFSINDKTSEFLRSINVTAKIWEVPNISFNKKMQVRDAGRWFGADNKWIWDPPDMHPCMPGVPDDEANFILYWLMSELMV